MTSARRARAGCCCPWSNLVCRHPQEADPEIIKSQSSLTSGQKDGKQNGSLPRPPPPIPPRSPPPTTDNLAHVKRHPSEARKADSLKLKIVTSKPSSLREMGRATRRIDDRPTPRPPEHTQRPKTKSGELWTDPSFQAAVAMHGIEGQEFDWKRPQVRVSDEIEKRQRVFKDYI